MHCTGGPERSGHGHEEDRGRHQAVQAGRSEGGAARGRAARHHGRGGERFRPAEGPHRALSRRRIRGGLPAQGEDRSGLRGWPRRTRGGGDHQRRPYRTDRRRQDLHLLGRGGDPHPHRASAARPRSDPGATTSGRFRPAAEPTRGAGARAAMERPVDAFCGRDRHRRDRRRPRRFCNQRIEDHRNGEAGWQRRRGCASAR